MAKHMLCITLPLIAAACFIAACSDEKAGDKPSSENPAPPPATSDVGYSAAHPVLRMPANSKQKLCYILENGQRVQYKLSAASKLHLGVSHGQEMGIDNPVPLHATRSEVRTINVKNDGEYCFQFDNRDSQTIDVTFSHKIL